MFDLSNSYNSLLNSHYSLFTFSGIYTIYTCLALFEEKHIFVVFGSREMGDGGKVVIN